MSWFDVDAALAEMEALTRQMDAMLGNRGLDGRHGLRLFPWNLDDATFSDEDDHLVWRGDLPGFHREDVEVSYSDGMLTVKAKRNGEPSVPQGLVLKHRERRAYEVHRSWTLPEIVDPDGISAALEDGVLTIRLPKRPESKPRQITVQT